VIVVYDAVIFYAMPNEIGKEPLEGYTIIGEPIYPEGLPDCVIRVEEKGAQKIMTVETGAGKERAEKAARFILERYSPEKILIVGTCGAMRRELKTGDIIICDPIFAEIFTEECAEPLLLPAIHPEDRLRSLAIEVLGEERLGENLTILYHEWPQKEYPQIAVVEMEDYWIGSVAQEKNIPFLAVRVVMEPYRERIIPREERTQKYQTWRRERFIRITTILQNKFLLPFLQKL